MSTTATTPVTAVDDLATRTCTLHIGGMTCASCVRRIEEALNRIDGVTDATSGAPAAPDRVTEERDRELATMKRQWQVALGTGLGLMVLMDVPLHGIRVDLVGDVEAGSRSDLHLRFTDASTGRPVDDLQPFLAAAGHVVVMREGATSFAHEHAEVRDDRGRPVFAVPGQTFGPELGLHAEFPTAGTYRLWGQFRTADDRVLTVPFTVQAR